MTGQVNNGFLWMPSGPLRWAFLGFYVLIMSCRLVKASAARDLFPESSFNQDLTGFTENLDKSEQTAEADDLDLSQFLLLFPSEGETDFDRQFVGLFDDSSNIKEESVVTSTTAGSSMFSSSKPMPIQHTSSSRFSLGQSLSRTNSFMLESLRKTACWQSSWWTRRVPETPVIKSDSSFEQQFQSSELNKISTSDPSRQTASKPVPLTSTFSLGSTDSSSMQSGYSNLESTLGIETEDSFYPHSHKLISFKKFALFDRKAMVGTGQGMILGNVFSKEGYRSFLGIPFAKPPVGCRRWKTAEKARDWPLDFIYDARKIGSHCVQLDPWGTSYFRDLLVGLSGDSAEDCLNLNVFTPTKARFSHMKKLVPVMFFVHGGMFTTGGNSAALYNPAGFVSRNDVVVVSPNYRLGIFGFLASQELKTDDSGVGNYGLTDLLVALEWVHKHIAAFGGDPNRITLVGHSAGAIMVNHLLLVLATDEYRAKGSWVYRVIQFSGAYGTAMERNILEVSLDESDGTNETVHSVFETLVEDTGCNEDDRLACLRSIDARTLEQIGINHNWSYQWGPVVDGRYIVASPKTLFKRGDFLQVPILVTDCQDDGTIFTIDEDLSTEAKFMVALTKYFPPDITPAIAAAYPVKEYGHSYYHVASALLRDSLFTCPVDDFAGRAASHLPGQVYYFRFRTALSVPWITSSLYLTSDYGVFHGSELVFLFQGLPELTIGQPHSVNTVQRRIISFMEGNLPDDPKYPENNKAVVVTGKYGIDIICKKWSRWPRNTEPFEGFEGDFKAGLNKKKEEEATSSVQDITIDSNARLSASTIEQERPSADFTNNLGNLSVTTDFNTTL